MCQAFLAILDYCPGQRIGPGKLDSADLLMKGWHNSLFGEQFTSSI